MKTGSKDMDSIFEYRNEITMIYGEAATGKTTLAKLAAIQAARDKSKVIFIDTEKGFSTERFKQLAGKDYSKLLERIIFFRPGNLSEQRKMTKDLMTIIEGSKIGLVIIDTIGSIYRAELKLDDKYANRTMAESIKILKWVANKNIPVIVTNQVYSDMNNNVRNVGGNMVLDACDCVILLNKNPRKFMIQKPEKKEARFEIEESGIKLI